MPILNWLTREEDVKAAGKAPYRLLQEMPKFSCANLSHGEKDSDNMLIQGDNLEALKALLPFYAGEVKCIFIDPPYNTKSAFDHYDDNLEHSKWLAMIWPRLEILRELLGEDGSIWVSMDDNEAHYCKVIMDEVFGRKNFVSNAIWQKKYSPQNDAKWLSDNHDHILIYARNKDIWRPNLLPRSEEMNKRYKNPDNDPKGPWKLITLHAKSGKDKNFKHTFGNGVSWSPPPGTFPRFGRETLTRYESENKIWFGKKGDSVPAVKNYLSEVKQGVTSLTIWLHEDVGHNHEAKTEVKNFNAEDVFSTPKPEKLIQRILHMASNKGDLVLDSFLGSGTTAAVAHKMGRRYIGIEMGEQAKTHCQVRLAKVIAGEQGGISEAVNWQGGGGFRFYRLGASAFDEQGRICPDISFQVLAAHIWFSETRTPWGALPGNSHPEDTLGQKPAHSPFLGIYNRVAYGLLYNGVLGDRRPDGGNVITSKTLGVIQEGMKAAHPDFDGELVIYGESSRIGDARLKRLKITFKQTPYDVKAR